MKNPNKNHHFVNWVDGMKINKSHFQDSDDATINLMTKANLISVNDTQYGLLPSINTVDDNRGVTLSIDGQNQLGVQLNYCKAVSLGGYYFDISEKTQALINGSGKFLNLEIPFDIESYDSDTVYIILSIDPYKTIPVGSSTEEEEPPRHPYALPKYTLNVIDENQINDSLLGANHIIVGKIALTEQGAALIEDYIPPCYSIQAHEDLVYIYSNISVFFSTIEKHCMQIIQKILQKKQTNDLAHMVLSISQNVWQYISSIITEFQIVDRTASPVNMVAKLMTLGRIVKNSMDVYTGTGKEELINYITSWSDQTQGDLEKILTDVISIEYKHYDVNLSMHTISKFTKILLSVFKKLDDLDYIGKKGDSNIFVKEEVVAKQNIKERRSFLLD